MPPRKKNPAYLLGYYWEEVCLYGGITLGLLVVFIVLMMVTGLW